MKVLSFIGKCLHFFFQLHSNFLCITFYLWKFPQKSTILKFFLFISIILYGKSSTKSLVLSEKWLHSLYQLYDNYICMPIIVSEKFPRNLRFYHLFQVILNFIIHMFDGKLQFYQKICPANFQMYSNCISLLIIVSEFVFQRNLQF